MLDGTAEFIDAQKRLFAVNRRLFYFIENCAKSCRHDFVMLPSLSGKARFGISFLALLNGELSLKATEGLKCAKHTFLYLERSGAVFSFLRRKDAFSFCVL